MKDFIFKIPTKIYFGNGLAKSLGKVCRELGGSKIFILSDSFVGNSPIMDTIKSAFEKESMEYILYTDSKPDPTIEMVDKAAEELKKSNADMVVAVGGGSSIDLAKAICMLMTNEGSVRDYLFGGSKAVTNPGVPLIAIPTTAGTGSEVTAASVITDVQNNIKLSVTHEYIIPKAAIIDPVLQKSMPMTLTASTGLDALTHAIESYVSLNAEPLSDAMGIQAIRLIGENLREVVADGNNLEARSNMALASLIAGIAFMNGGLGAVHGIAQSIGGLHHTAHGITNGLLLPYVMERNYVGNLKKFRDIAVALGENVEGLSLREAARASIEAVFDLQDDLKVPSKLKEIGIDKKDFPAIIDGTMEYRLLPINPCKLKAQDIENILTRAYEGR